jgi:hypothetical protein
MQKQPPEVFKQDYMRVPLNEKEAKVYIFTTYRGKTRMHFSIKGERHYAWMTAYGLHVEEVHTFNDIVVELKPKYNYGYLCNREVDVIFLFAELKKCNTRDEMDSLITEVLKPMFVSRMEHDAREEYKKLNESFRQQKQDLLNKQKQQEQYNPDEWLKLLSEWRRMYR